MSAPVAMAIGAHPDDIEFLMAGTLLLLRKAGWEIHYMNLATGNCGSAEFDANNTRHIRAREARAAAGLLGAVYHPPVVDDLEIVYSVPLLRSVAAIVREVNPRIVLTHSPQDYMEDHMVTSRLLITAAFARGMSNFKTVPNRPAVTADTCVYHALPHGLRDGLRQRVVPGLYVDTTGVHATKRKALAAHQSQQAWLDASQGMNSYLLAMEDMSLEVGKMSGRFKHAEGWRRHLHLGFSGVDNDPLTEALTKKCMINQDYESRLNSGYESGSPMTASKTTSDPL